VSERSKERPWKGRKPQKGFESSNLSLSATFCIAKSGENSPARESGEAWFKLRDLISEGEFMKRFIAVMAGLLFLAGTGLALEEQTAGASEKPKNQVLTDTKKEPGKLERNKLSKTKLTPKKISAGAKLGKKINAKQRVQLNPQPEPPMNKSSFKNASGKVELNPQPDPPMDSKSSLGNAKQRVQLNPQPEPPKPALGGAGKGIGVKH
jgi:hypothetical protein